MKKIIILTIIAGGLFFLYRYLSTAPTSTISNDQADLILYWGEGCSHCEKVKEYIASNKLDSKMKISLKEVYYNPGNRKELESAVAKCPEIDTSQGIGVPLAIDPKTQKCISGDQPIIDWLSAR